MRTKNDWTCHMWHWLIDVDKLELVKTIIWVFGDQVTVSVTETSKKSLYEVIDQTVVIDGAEEYRAESGSERNAGSQTNIFPVNSDWRLKLNSRRVYVKYRLQVAICEPVEVDDDGDIFDKSATLSKSTKSKSNSTLCVPRHMQVSTSLTTLLQLHSINDMTCLLITSCTSSIHSCYCLHLTVVHSAWGGIIVTLYTGVSTSQKMC